MVAMLSQLQLLLALASVHCQALYPLQWKEKVINDEWFQLLGNPCRAEPTPPDWANDPVLNATGRARSVYHTARGTLHSVKKASNFMASCTYLRM